MPDYSQGKIYKVTCGETGDIYIGSTVLSLPKRLAQHNFISNGCATKDFIKPKIELIEEFPCETKQELLWRERKWYDELDCVNIHMPIATKSERFEKNRLCKMKYRKENRESILNQNAIYYQNNKKHKADYYQKNKEKIYAWKSEIIQCECGDSIQRVSFSRHKKSQKHLNKMANLE